MALVYGLFAPNAPNLIAPEVFGGAGKEAVAALRALEVPTRVRPDVILVATPHWMAPVFYAQGSPRPRQVYDFSGFPRKLYAVRYEPPGDPELARRLVEQGKRRHLDVELTEDHGLDHGAWAPLVHIAPGARIPVVPLSVTHVPAEDHLAWGRAIGEALAKTEKRVAIVGTGSITHRLDRFQASGTEDWPEGARIEAEIVDRLLAKDVDGVVHFDREKWETVAPEGDLAPLFVVLGAMGSAFTPRLAYTGQVFGAAGLSTLEFLTA